MLTSNDCSSANSENPSLLVGIILDVSSSMKRNWRNKDGKKLPRIELIRDAFNKFVKEEQQRRLNTDPNLNNIELFCLGMGFKTITHWTDIELSYDREHSLGNAQARVVTGVICDLIALGEILPTREKATDFKAKLNQKWLQCSNEILYKSVIAEDVYADLLEYIQKALFTSAVEKFHQSLRYKLSSSVQQKRLSHFLQNIVKEREEKIKVTSSSASAEYADDLFRKTSSDFHSNTSRYINLIRHHVEKFVETYTASALRSMTLGFEIQELVDDLDEAKVLILAKRIQHDLEIEVSKHIKLVLALHEQKLFAAKRSIAASLNKKEVRTLTERFIRKFGWDILKPLVEKTVFTIFVEQFEQQVKESFPYWIQLAAEREVIRPFNQLANVLPEIFEPHVYSEKVMFGCTPFFQAIDKAAIRFINKDYKDRRKILVIVSDGEFEDLHSIKASIDLLKRRGVTIICCLISDKNILSRLVKRSTNSWPQGAQFMIDIASQISDQVDAVTQWNELDLASAFTNEKLCFQINQSSVLEDILEFIFNSHDNRSIFQ